MKRRKKRKGSISQNSSNGYEDGGIYSPRCGVRLRRCSNLESHWAKSGYLWAECLMIRGSKTTAMLSLPSTLCPVAPAFPFLKWPPNTRRIQTKPNTGSQLKNNFRSHASSTLKPFLFQHLSSTLRNKTSWISSAQLVIKESFIQEPRQNQTS